MKTFDGKVAVVTGGSQGIGLAAAQAFAENGAHVIIIGRCQESLDAAKKLISGNVQCIQADISNLSDLDRAYSFISQKHEAIDVLFANAGVTERVSIEAVTEEIFDQIVAVNYKGTFFTVQKAVPYLAEGAVVILNASIAGMVAFDHHSVYSSTKAAVIQLAKNFAADLIRKRVRVNSISPGYIKTPIWDPWVNSPIFEEFCMEVPFENRLGTAKEIANTVLFLSSDASGYITGENIVVDGGLINLYMRYNKK